MAKVNINCPQLPWMIDFHTTADDIALKNQMKSVFAQSTLKHKQSLSVRAPAGKCRLTQIAHTICPDITLETLEKLFENGMNIARFKMLDYPDSQKLQDTMVKLQVVNDHFSVKMGRVYPIVTAFELQGNSVRTGKLKNKAKELYLRQGDHTTVRTDKSYEEFVDKDAIFINYPKLAEVVKPGDKIMIGEEMVTLEAISAAESVLKCIVEKAGKILNLDQVSVSGVPLDVPEISIEDERGIECAIKASVDCVFLSNIISGKVVRQFREKLKEKSYIMVVSKIENALAVDNIDDIIRESDAIIVDGDSLMNELSKEKVFLVQKSVTAKCNEAAKPIGYSVGFSMLRKADILEIANTIMDGVDILIISKDATDDKVFLQDLGTVNNVCREAEAAVFNKEVYYDLVALACFPESPAKVVGMAVVGTSFKVNAAAIIVLTVSGRTPKMISNYRPRCPIIAITRNERVAQQLHLFRAVDSIFYVKEFVTDWEKDTECRLQLGMTYGKCSGFIKMGDAVITVKGYRPGSGFTNCIRVVYASSFDVDYNYTGKKQAATIKKLSLRQSVRRTSKK